MEMDSFQNENEMNPTGWMTEMKNSKMKVELEYSFQIHSQSFNHFKPLNISILSGEFHFLSCEAE